MVIAYVLFWGAIVSAEIGYTSNSTYLFWPWYYLLEIWKFLWPENRKFSGTGSEDRSFVRRREIIRYCPLILSWPGNCE